MHGAFAAWAWGDLDEAFFFCRVEIEGKAQVKIIRRGDLYTNIFPLLLFLSLLLWGIFFGMGGLGMYMEWENSNRGLDPG